MYICVCIYIEMCPHPEVVEREAGQSHTRDVLGELLQDLGLLGLRGEDHTRITPGLEPGSHQV